MLFRSFGTPAFPLRNTHKVNRRTRLETEILGLLTTQPDLSFNIVDLTKMPERIGAHVNPFMRLAVNRNPSGAHVATLSGDWENFYVSRRLNSARQQERRYRRKLEKYGAILFSKAADSEAITLVMDTLYAQKGRSFARMGVENIFDRAGYKEFFTGVACRAKSNDLVMASCLRIGETIAVTNLGIQFRGDYYLVLSSYVDGEMSRFGPGRFHLHELIKRTIDNGGTKFDFTIGDEDYKRIWADVQLTLYDHTAACTVRGWAAVLFLVGLRHLKRFIKQTPAAWRAFTHLRSLKNKLAGSGAVPADTASDE